MVEFFIHPGFVKTGTTFFQENIIPNIINTQNIGKPYKNKLSYEIKKLVYSNKKKVTPQKIMEITNY